jgi:[acyl-carrier-protein] S-malonyltransferase
MAPELTAALLHGRELRGRGPAPFVLGAGAGFVAGHGLGDLAALVAADALDLADALRLAVLREQLVAHASAHVGGGMLAVVGADAATSAAWVAERSGARVARYDSPAHVVVAGSHAQLRSARTVAAGLRILVVDLPAPAALHTPAMSTCADVFAAVLRDVGFREPSIPVYSSVTAGPMDDPRAALASCLEQPVLWTETIRALEAAGTTRFVESGATALGDLVCETLADAGSELVHA